MFANPDTRSPARFLGWLLAQQRLVLFVSALTAVLEWVPGAIGPYLIGRIVDEGITARDLGRVGELSLILFGLVLIGVTAGVLNHTVVVRSWLIGMYGPMMMVNRKSVQLGHVLPQRTPTGEVLSVAAGDADEFGALTEVFARAFGRAGVVPGDRRPGAVHVGVARGDGAARRATDRGAGPAAAAAAAAPRGGRADPIGGPDRDGDRHRGRAADPARHRWRAHLRPQLRRRSRSGPGRPGAAAGIWQALVESASVLFSGLFLVVLTWLGAREVVGGRLSVGELISFFGYALFMVWPIQTFFELAQRWVRSIVSARKAIAVLSAHPPWEAPEQPLRLPEQGVLHDDRSGFTAEPGAADHDRVRAARTTPRRSPTGWAATCRPTTTRSAWRSPTA